MKRQPKPVKTKRERSAKSWVELLESRRLLSAVTVYVDPTATGGSGDGSSWVNAYTDLEPALQYAQATEAASSGSTFVVDVAEGTYSPAQTPSQAATFSMASGISIYGGFQGGRSNPGLRDPTAFTTVLTGSGVSDHVVTAVNIDNTGVLDGVTVTAGNAIVSG